MRILQVQKYNTRKKEQWEQDCKKTNYPKEIMPCLSLYLFLDYLGNKKKKGWVVYNNTSSRLFKTKKEAKHYINLPL